MKNSLVKEAMLLQTGCSRRVKNVKPARNHVNMLNEYLRENKLEKSKIGVMGEYTTSPAQIEVASDILENERAC